MNQTLHIFRKDTRHLYPEVFLTLAGTVAFAWAAPWQWNPAINNMQGIRALVAPLLRVLLPVAWLVLISRLVHDESLVGDRQFWITRPYRWTSLLAAKLLFLLVFLSLPFLGMQLYLLQHAGLDIRSSIPDLLLYQLRLTAIFFVPFFAVAAVTSNFARLTLTLLLGLLYLGLLFAIGAHLTEKHLFPQIFFLFGFIFFTMVLLSLITVQYATRRTRTIRNSLLALPVLLLVLSLVVPAKSLIHHIYPALSSSGMPQWIFDPSPARRQTGTGHLAEVEGQIALMLPVHEVDSPTGERFKVNAIAAILDAPGFHWSSPFLDSNGVELSNTPHDPTITVMIPRNVFERVRTTPVDIHLQLASTVYGTDAATPARASLPSFPAPDHGLCPLNPEGAVGNCRYAFRLATPIDIAAHVSSQPCDGDHTPAQGQPTAALATTFIGSDDNRLAFDFDPVAITRLNLVLPGSTFDHPLPAFLCSDSPIAFTAHPILRRGTFSVDAHQLVIDEYAQRRK